jgi:hypothetical protein
MAKEQRMCIVERCCSCPNCYYDQRREENRCIPLDRHAADDGVLNDCPLPKYTENKIHICPMCHNPLGTMVTCTVCRAAKEIGISHEMKPCDGWKPGDGCGSGGRCGDKPCTF